MIMIPILTCGSRYVVPILSIMCLDHHIIDSAVSNQKYHICTGTIKIGHFEFDALFMVMHIIDCKDFRRYLAEI